MSAVSICVVGAGAIGSAHIQLIKNNPLCELHSIVDTSAQALELAKATHTRFLPNLQEMLQGDLPDGVILASPNHLHVSQALDCIKKGLPILLEKPIATTVKEGKQLVQAVAKLGAKVLIGHHRAHSPIMQQAALSVQSGALGRVVCVSGFATFFKPSTYFTQASWRAQPGGGPILINLIHEIHNLRMLCGEITQVQAMCSNAVRGFEVEDTVAINFRFESGVLGTFILSDTAAGTRSWEQTSGENKAYAHYPMDDCYVITGTLGSLSVPSMRLQLFNEIRDASWFNSMKETLLTRAGDDDPLANQISHFIQVIKGICAPLVSANDGLKNLNVIECILEAAKSGKVVTIG